MADKTTAEAYSNKSVFCKTTNHYRYYGIVKIVGETSLCLLDVTNRNITLDFDEISILRELSPKEKAEFMRRRNS